MGKMEGDFVPRDIPGRDGTVSKNPGPSHPVARFWACPVVPLSWDNEETSVPLSRKVVLSQPVGNPNSLALYCEKWPKMATFMRTGKWEGVMPLPLVSVNSLDLECYLYYFWNAKGILNKVQAQEIEFPLFCQSVFRDPWRVQPKEIRCTNLTHTVHMPS